MDYFGNIDFRIVVHRYFMQGDAVSFTPNTSSIEFIRSGQILLCCNGKKMELTAPVLFWMKKGSSYQFSAFPGEKKRCEHLYCDCSGEKADKMIAFLEEKCPAGFLVPSDPEKVSTFFFDMIKYYRMGRMLYQGELSVLFDQILLEIIRTLRKHQIPEDDFYGIRLLGDEIRKNPFARFDFASIAAGKGISLYHFRRLFRLMHQMPPVEFVREQKMIRAAELLQLTNMRIKEIMFTCAFRSEMDFSRSFKKYSNYSPREFRRRCRMKEKKS